MRAADTDAVEQARAEQLTLAARVTIPTGPVPPPRTIAGLDVSYGTDRAVAAAVVVDAATGAVLEEAVVDAVVTFPYVPGLLAFREVPALMSVLAQLQHRPDLLLCDGQGLAHPQRCGLASHLGVVTATPAIGSAKNQFVGEHAEPGPRRGDRSPLVDAGETVGEVLRTQDGVRPVYVSPGHLVGVLQATDLVLATTTAYRVPDPIRRADHLSRQALRA